MVQARMLLALLLATLGLGLDGASAKYALDCSCTSVRAEVAVCRVSTVTLLFLCLLFLLLVLSARICTRKYLGDRATLKASKNGSDGMGQNIRTGCSNHGYQKKNEAACKMEIDAEDAAAALVLPAVDVRVRPRLLLTVRS